MLHKTPGVSMHVEHKLPEAVHCGGVIGSEYGDRRGLLEDRGTRLLGPGDGVERAIKGDHVHGIAYHDGAPDDTAGRLELP